MKIGKWVKVKNATLTKENPGEMKRTALEQEGLVDIYLKQK